MLVKLEGGLGSCSDADGQRMAQSSCGEGTELPYPHPGQAGLHLRGAALLALSLSP